MPLRHMVLVELKPDITDSTIDELVSALRALPSQIDVIRSYEVNVDLKLVEGNATIGIIAAFDDVDGWRAYGPHPAHQAVLQELIAPNALRRTALQAQVATV